MVISIAFWLIAILFIVLGIFSMKSSKPSGIYSNIKAPTVDKIKDLKAYNRAVGWLMIGFGIFIALLGFIAIIITSDAKRSLLMISLFPGAIVMMIIYETVISPKYLVQKK